MPQILGIKDLTDLLANRIVVDMDDVLHRLDVNEAPFLYFLSKLPKKECHNPKFEWNEKEVVTNWSDTNATGAGGNWDVAAADDGTIGVPNLEYFLVGDVIQIPTVSFVNIVITAKAAATGSGNLTGETVDGSLIDLSGVTESQTDYIKILSSADESGADMRTPKSTKATNEFNYIQIFRTGIGLTEVEDATELYDGKDRDEQRLEKGIEQARKKEHAFLFGARAYQSTGLVTGAHPQWFTGGVYNMLPTTQIDTDANGTLTETEWIAWVESALKYGSDAKIIFCAPIFGNALTKWAMGKLTIVSQKETSYGMRITKYTHPIKGEVTLFIHEKVFDKAPYNGMAMCVDLANTNYRFLKGLDDKFYADIGLESKTEYKDEYRAYCGLQIQLYKTHRILKGVTAYSA